MEDLIDIQGLDQISWWPLALGWWVLIAASISVVIVMAFLWLKKRKYKKSWQYKSFSKLQDIHSQLTESDHKQVLQSLSLEMRKIAMLTTKRESCAGLIGEQWLQWLQEHDPAGFNWLENGELLVAFQYMPNLAHDNHQQISKLITAAQGWVQKC